MLKELEIDNNATVIRVTRSASAKKNSAFAEKGKIFLDTFQRELIECVVLHNWHITIFTSSRQQRKFIFWTQNEPSPPAIEITLPGSEIKILTDVEEIFNLMPGKLNILLQKAKRARNKEVNEDNISVKLGAFKEIENNDQNPQVNGMKYYELTERAHTLLQETIAAYTTLMIKEKRKAPPNLSLLENIQRNKELALKILNNASHFTSLDQMQTIIDNYSPLVKELYHS